MTTLNSIFGYTGSSRFTSLGFRKRGGSFDKKTTLALMLPGERGAGRLGIGFVIDGIVHEVDVESALRVVN